MWDQVLPEGTDVVVRRLGDGRVLALIPPDEDGGRYSLAVVAADFPAVEGSFQFRRRATALGELKRWQPSAGHPAPRYHSGGSWAPFTPNTAKETRTHAVKKSRRGRRRQTG